MCQSQCESFFGCDFMDQEPVNTVEFLLRDPPKWSELFDWNAIYEDCLPLFAQPVRIMKGTPEKER